jgi:hypothetical protein
MDSKLYKFEFIDHKDDYGSDYELCLYKLKEPIHEGDDVSQVALLNTKTNKFTIVWQDKLNSEFSVTPMEAAVKGVEELQSHIKHHQGHIDRLLQSIIETIHEGKFFTEFKTIQELEDAK